MADQVRILVVGCGLMGASHARAYHKMAEFDIVGLVSRGPDTREALSRELGGLPTFSSFDEALAAAKPDAVSINTYPDTHAEYAIRAMENGAHVFTEKPLSQSVERAQAMVDTAVKHDRKLVVGYILRHHPAWEKFVEVARTLGKPLAMRMNLNQQSSGAEWVWHKSLMASLPPLVDCGVHYVDIMCQMTRAVPVRVSGIGARLSEELEPGIYNYGQLQVTFDDGSVGWYEAGWGPMVSEEAFFVKDVVGPQGCVSIVKKESAGGSGKGSADIDLHTQTNMIRHHRSALDDEGEFAQSDELIDMSDEPDHQALCDREQSFFLKAIREDLDLTDHMIDAVNSLRIVLAADESVKTGQTVEL